MTPRVLQYPNPPGKFQINIAHTRGNDQWQTHRQSSEFACKPFGTRSVNFEGFFKTYGDNQWNSTLEFGQNIGRGNSVGMEKQTFIVIYKPGPAWLIGKPISEQPLKEHGKYMLDLYKSGVLRFAGPFEDDTGGAAVFEASGEDEAKTLVDQDPAVVSRVFVYELRPWRLVPWEQYVRAESN